MNEQLISTLLNTIVDPCSRSAGVPAGLVDLGLVRKIELTATTAGYYVRVTLCVTEPGCVMGGCFAREAELRLAELPDIHSVCVELDGAAEWTSTDMSAAYRDRLTAARATRFAMRRMPLPSPPDDRPGSAGLSGKSRPRQPGGQRE